MSLTTSAEVMAQWDLHSIAKGLENIPGKPENLASPFVTAGNRVYMVGFQNGSFPDLGWHIPGEMGGIWNHPIKLMDGFDASLTVTSTGRSMCLDEAKSFVNYPFANNHHFSWPAEKISVDRLQFVPDQTEGLIISYRIVNQNDHDVEMQFQFSARVDLRPTWLGERTNMIDAEDELRYDAGSSMVIAQDKKNTWYTAFGSSLAAERYDDKPGRCNSSQSRANGSLYYTIRIKGNGGVVNIPVFIAGSYRNEKALRETYQVLKTQGEKKFREKMERYKAIRNTSRLVLPDQKIAEMYDWLKFNTDWLVREVPELGVGLSAGLPDYPWWFGCDNTYALQGVLASGDHTLAKKTIELIADISARTNGNNGRIIHEVSTNGAVFNAGNVNETAQFIHLVWVYYTWTGDKDLLTRLYPFLQRGMKWLKEMDPDGNQYPNGAGMMEIHGLDTEMIDVVVYTQQALSSLAMVAEEMKDVSAAQNYRKEAEQLKKKINDEWWSSSAGSYADFRASDAATIEILDAAIVRADTLGKAWTVSELKERRSKLRMSDSITTNPQVVYHNWVVNTPLETGVADPQKALTALKTSRKFENAFGAYVTGIDRSVEPDSIVLASRKKVFSYTGAVMTLPTAVQAIGAANAGEPDLALEFIQKLRASFSYVLPGSMYEVSPDFGMFTQAWNIYGVAVPIVQKFLGVQPLAHKRTIVITPELPKEWNDAAIDNLKIGVNIISLALMQTENSMTFRVRQKETSWKIVFPFKTMPSRVTLNGKLLEPKRYADQKIELNGGDIDLQVFYER